MARKKINLHRVIQTIKALGPERMDEAWETVAPDILHIEFVEDPSYPALSYRLKNTTGILPFDLWEHAAKSCDIDLLHFLDTYNVTSSTNDIRWGSLIGFSKADPHHEFYRDAFNLLVGDTPSVKLTWAWAVSSPYDNLDHIKKLMEWGQDCQGWADLILEKCWSDDHDRIVFLLPYASQEAINKVILFHFRTKKKTLLLTLIHALDFKVVDPKNAIEAVCHCSIAQSEKISMLQMLLPQIKASSDINDFIKIALQKKQFDVVRFFLPYFKTAQHSDLLLTASQTGSAKWIKTLRAADLFEDHLNWVEEALSMAIDRKYDSVIKYLWPLQHRGSIVASFFSLIRQGRYDLIYKVAPEYDIDTIQRLDWTSAHTNMPQFLAFLERTQLQKNTPITQQQTSTRRL